LTAAASHLIDLLAACPRLKVLVTSRRALGVRGEYVLSVAPFPIHHLPTADLARLAASSAVALFVERATALQPNFVLEASNAAAIASLCVQLDGLPLAIELAAARTQLFTPAEIAERLARQPLAVGGTLQDLPPRQQTLRNSLDWSYALLTGPAQAVFRQMAVFTSGCSLEALEAVVHLPAVAMASDEPALEQALHELIISNLIARTSLLGQLRFVMLATVRYYAAERLHAETESRLVSERHATYFLQSADRTAGALGTPEQARSFALIDLENDNLRSALGFLLHDGQLERLLDTCAHYIKVWLARGEIVEAQRWYEQAIAAAREPSRTPPVAQKQLAVALNNLGMLARKQGHFSTAMACYEEGIAMYRALGDQLGEAQTLKRLGILLLSQGDRTAARQYSDASLHLFRQLGHRRGIAELLHNLGSMACAEERLDDAAALYHESLAILEELNDPISLAQTRSNLAEVLQLQGHVGTARPLYEAALALFRELRQQSGVTIVLIMLAGLAIEVDDLMLAARSVHEAIDLATQSAMRPELARALELAALLGHARGTSVDAVGVCAAAVALRDSIGLAPAPHEQQQLDRLQAELRAALLPASFAERWQTGLSLDMDTAASAAQAMLSRYWAVSSFNTERLP
jgi:predicted ATPase